MTNYEKIKNMSVEEIIKFFYSHCDCRYCVAREICDNIKGDCYDAIKEWLNQEVKENNNG